MYGQGGSDVGEELPGTPDGGGTDRAEGAGVEGAGGGVQADAPWTLLQCDEDREDGGRADGEIAEALDVGMSTVARVRRRCVEEGIEAALNRRRQVNRRPKVLDGDAEARLVAIACGEAPAGRAKWTLRLLADRLVELDVVEAVSPETVRVTVKKTISSPG